VTFPEIGYKVTALATNIGKLIARVKVINGIRRRNKIVYLLILILPLYAKENL
jgi:hypothetical protein